MSISNKLNVTYSVVLPDGKRFAENAESNAVITEILTYSVLKEIHCDKTEIRVGEIARVTVTVTNKSAIKLFGNGFKISRSDDALFVTGSVKVNGIAQPAYDPIAGFDLPDADPDATIVIEYQIKAVKTTSTPVTHFATLRYTVNDRTRGNAAYSENTNSVSLTVISDGRDTDLPVPPDGDRCHVCHRIPYNCRSNMFYCDRCDCCCCDCCDCCYCDCCRYCDRCDCED